LLPHLGRDEEDVDPERAGDVLVERVQEERRLMYVGITRAQRSLNLSWCKKRRRAREEVSREPSRFIQEMGLGGADVNNLPPETMSPKARLDMLKALLKKPS
jgi:ATP-dependent DNA helicase Rep